MKPASMPSHIICKRLKLKRLSLSAAPLMFAAIYGGRRRLQRFLPSVASAKNLDDQKKYIRCEISRWRRHKAFEYGIYRIIDGVYMGAIAVHTVNWTHRCCELLFWVGHEFEGGGYVTEAVKHLRDKCFELGFYRVEIRCEPDNLRSISVASRCGLRLEGNLIENRYVHGRFRNTLIFGVTKKKSNVLRNLH